MKTILDAIGNTPLLTIEGINVKLEHLNPSGSIKDRIAKFIVNKAEKSGKLKKGYTIIEATSGNTGNALSLVGSVKGYKVVVVMPKGLSIERSKIMKAYGANIIYVKKDCFSCAIKKAESLGKKPKTYLPHQFTNEWNIKDHELFLGKEIIKQVKKVDAFVAGVGTGGTLIGVGRALKKKFPKVKLFAVEPDECSALVHAGIGSVLGKKSLKKLVCKHHDIEGIGDGIIPEIIKRNKKMIDGVVEIKSKEAIKESSRIAKAHGLFVGPSSGANFLAAKKLRKKFKHVVTVFADEGEKYLSER
jgi:cysteine synthase A|tara:strand:+ start:8262 stop:9167 length:906 start_codon:yes stop_codon:yes gene_type:complete